LKTMVNVANLEPQPFDPVTGVDFQVDIRTYVSFMPGNDNRKLTTCDNRILTTQSSVYTLG